MITYPDSPRKPTHNTARAHARTHARTHTHRGTVRVPKFFSCLFIYILTNTRPPRDIDFIYG